MYLNFQTKRLRLCTLDEQAVQSVWAYRKRNIEFWRAWSPTYPSDFLEKSAVSRWLAEQYQLQRQGRQVRFFLFHYTDDSLVYPLGDVTYSQIQHGAAQSCFVGYKIDAQVQGQGYITEALLKTNQYMFEMHKLHRIEANIMPRNVASIRVVEKLGFAYEGISRQLLHINGTWEDHARYALLGE